VGLRIAAVTAAAVVSGCFLFMNADPVSGDAKRHMSVIQDGLDRDVGRMALCVQSGPFPHDDHRGSCFRCGDLEAAGLLERSEGAQHSEARPHWIYALTAKGKQVYTEDEDTATGVRGPRFCFGRARLHHLVAAQSALNAFGAKRIGVEYVMEAVDPHPLLSDPAIAPLKLPRPTGDNPKLFAPQITTVTLSADGGTYIESDPSFRYGNWINR
jgi:hypothetical protein